MIEFQINDMTCGHCVDAITKAVAEMDPAASVDIDLPTHRVRITGTQRRAEMETAIREAGYTPQPVG